ncbi:MAG: right-handed parallel beta-helix repeat-containing protein, partial [Thermoplasmata archaeon]
VVISPTTHCRSEGVSENTVVGERNLGDAQFNYWGTMDLPKIERMVENVNFLNPLDTSPTKMDIDFITGNAFWSGTVYLERGVIVDGSLTIKDADIVFNNTIGQNYIHVNMDMNIDNSDIDSNFGNYTFLYTNNSNGAITNSSLTHQRAITSQADNITIDNNEINRGSYGIICMKGSTGNTIITNNVSLNSWYSVFLWYSPSNHICDNNISSNWEGAYLWFSSNNYIASNTLSLNKFGGIYTTYSSGNTIINNTISSNGKKGIDLSSSMNNIITKNIISLNNLEGIELSGPSNNSITFNNISDNWKGISLGISSNNIVAYNNISSNSWMGVHLFYSNDNIFTSNNISSNDNYNLYLEDSSNNRIYHNNIINNTNQAYDNRDDNYWDDGYPSGGNYWSDYVGDDYYKGPNQDQPGVDGIGDTNYTIDSDSVDNYPLMEPYIYKPLVNYTILKQGWNLISIPVIQENQGLRKVLEMIDGYYDAVQWYDNNDINDSWKHHKVGKSYGNDLIELNETIGFWIHITKPGDTIFLYNGTQPTSNQTIILHEGWNLVGYPSLTSYNITEGLNELIFGTDIDAIWSYDAQNQIWDEIKENDYFEKGNGYWIHAKTDSVWEVPL